MQSNRKLIDLDVDVVRANFYMVGSELFRVDGGNTNHKIYTSLNHQAMVRIGDDRVMTSRVIFVLQSGYSSGEYLLLNDDGKYVEVKPTVMQMFAYKKSNKINKTQWSKSGHSERYVARWVNAKGERVSKTFDTHGEAIKYQESMVQNVWGKELKDLNLYDSYFAA